MRTNSPGSPNAQTKTWLARVGLSKASLLLASVGAVTATLAGVFATSAWAELNVSGVWNANYHCEVGWCAGEDFPALGATLVQEKGSKYVQDGTDSGTLEGHTLTLHGDDGGYSYTAILTISPDGRTWSGPLSDSKETHGTDTGVRVSGPLQSTVSGVVHDNHGKAAPGVTLKLEGTSAEQEAVSMSTVSSASGEYSFEVSPGTYNVVASGEMTDQYGGKLAITQEGSVEAGDITTPPVNPAPQCSGKATEATCALNPLEAGETETANFTFTYCAATDRTTNGKPPTGCPIVFIPGFLGSRLKCSTGEVWTNIPNPDFKDMPLEPDGITNSGAPGSCSNTIEPIPGQEGVVGEAPAGKDIYASTLTFLNRIATNGAYAFTYDWRKSPELALPALDKQVDEVLKSTGASRVVLMAHSMGGLVTQAYIANETYANKVIRAVTIGTPYWGAPKSHVALMSGKSNEFSTEWAGLDFLIDVRGLDLTSSENNYLQRAARTMQGLFWLYPSANYGPWLKVIGEAYSSQWRGGTAIDPWVQSLGGTPALVDSAMAGHAKLDGFKTNGVDYQIVVGTGVPTITSIQVQENPFGDAQVKTEFGSGDGTVPALSGTQGAFASKLSVIDKVPVHLVCNIGHVQLPGNASVQGRVEGFLLKGEEVNGGEECPYTGKVWQYYEIPVAKPTLGAKSSSVDSSAQVITATGASLTLAQATEQELVQVIQSGGQTIVVADDHNPVTLKLTGHALGLSVNSITSAHKGNTGGSGPVQHYGPINGTVTLAESGTVKQNGKSLKAVRAGSPPHTTAHVKRHGHRFVVRLSVKHHGKILGTYTRIGKGASHRYSEPLTLTAKQLKSLRFASVDRFGDWERQEKAPR